MKDGGRLPKICISLLVPKSVLLDFLGKVHEQGWMSHPTVARKSDSIKCTLQATSPLLPDSTSLLPATRTGSWTSWVESWSMKLPDSGVRELFTTMRRDSMKSWVSPIIAPILDEGYLSCVAVLPPDEDAQPFKNNSVYTNAVAALSIELADRVSCVTRKRVPRDWLNIASNLYFPFDNATQTHLEYEGFDLSEPIDRAPLVERWVHICLLRKYYYQTSGCHSAGISLDVADHRGGPTKWFADLWTIDTCWWTSDDLVDAFDWFSWTGRFRQGSTAV